MNKLTMSYTVKSNGETNTLNFEKDFESIPTLQEVEEFVTGFIDGMDLEDGYECTCGCNDLNEEDKDAEFVLQMADMVEDIFEDVVIDTVEEYMDSVLVEVDEVKNEDIVKLAYVKGIIFDQAQDVFFKGFVAGLSHVEDIMLRKFDEMVEAVDSSEECCLQCECFGEPKVGTSTFVKF